MEISSKINSGVLSVQMFWPKSPHSTLASIQARLFCETFMTHSRLFSAVRCD